MTNYEALGIREATREEMHIYYRVEEVLDTLDESEVERFTEIVSNRVFQTIADESPKAIYQRIYRLGKKYGFTVDELETWYCID